MFYETIRVPQERIGVIVGRNGRIKKKVEQLTNTSIEVDSEGIVTIKATDISEDPVLAWKARDIIKAMARGFSPQNAMTLIAEDARLIVISLRDIVGSSPSQQKRVAGRVIGERGRTRRLIELNTETKISVYGRTISILGFDPGLEYARKAVDMLIAGAPHKTVYTRLEKMRRDMNRQQAELWEPTDL